MTRRLILAVLSAALIVPVVRARQAAPDVKAPGAPVDSTLFAAAAADCGEAEVTLAELGLQKASDPDLQKLSRRMIDEHGQAGKALRSLYATRNINLPTAIDSRIKFRLQSLAGLTGADFDRAYVRAQFLMHQDILDLYETEALRGDDPQVQDLAAKLLPMIREHFRTMKARVAKADRPQTEAGEKTER